MSTISQSFATKPVSLELCEYAVAAARFGQGFVIGFSNYQPIILRHLWKQLTSAACDHVCSIRNRKDVTKLEKSSTGCGLVLVYNFALLEEVAWIVSMSDPITNARPCIIVQTRGDLTFEELPLPLLSLNCTSDEERSLLKWLSTDVPATAWSAAIETSDELDLAPQLIDLFSPSCFSAEEWSNRQLVHALLFGQKSCSSDSDAIIGIENYAAIRRLLCSAMVVGGNHHIDPLALAMVGRANLYLKLVQDYKDGAETALNLSLRHDLQRIRGSQTNKDLITRRELVDLGNPKGLLLRNIIERLSESTKGCSNFQQLGLSHSCPPETKWRTLTQEKKLSLLLGWSYKQIRTHFEALHRQQLVGGERESANGPWLYRLPESLEQVIHQFHWLPKPEDLFPMQETG